MEPSLLVVEDDRDFADAIAAAVQNEGYRVEHVASGIDALARLANERFELVLLDLEIEELSGGGVLRVISDLAIHTPVFVMSAKPSGWQNDAFRHGATACLRKPFDRRRLLELFDAFRTSGTRGVWPGDVRQLSAEDLAKLAKLPSDALDALPFGAIRLDAERRIDRFNTFEGQASTFFPPSVIGARFSDIAPCSLVKDFAAAIEEGYASGDVDRVLRFVFPHHGARAVVSVRVYGDPESGTLWILVSKARGELAGDLPDDVLGDALPRSDA